LSTSHDSTSTEGSHDAAQEEQSGSGSGASTPPSEPEPAAAAKNQPKSRTFFGFDEEDEFMSSDEVSEDGKSNK